MGANLLMSCASTYSLACRWPFACVLVFSRELAHHCNVQMSSFQCDTALSCSKSNLGYCLFCHTLWIHEFHDSVCCLHLARNHSAMQLSLLCRRWRQTNVCNHRVGLWQHMFEDQCHPRMRFIWISMQLDNIVQQIVGQPK